MATTPRVCDFDACGRAVRAKGLCASHYRQARTGGELVPIRRINVPRPSPETHFFASVVEEGDCWAWTSTREDKMGYPIFRRHDYEGYAHRWIYEFMVARIPDGLTLDHLCRNPACVNPWHLEPVPQRINTLRGTSPWAVNARKTHCKHGHEFTPENTIPASSGGRKCRACDVKMRREKRQRRRVQAA